MTTPIPTRPGPPMCFVRLPRSVSIAVKRARGSTPARLRAVARHLAAHGPTTQAALAVALGIPRGSISPLLAGSDWWARTGDLWSPYALTDAGRAALLAFDGARVES